MSKRKMTRDEMIERLQALEVGKKIIFTKGQQAGVVFEVVGIKCNSNEKLCQTTVGLLQEGKPEKESHVRKFGKTAGTVIEISNIQHFSWYAQSPYMNWDFVS